LCRQTIPIQDPLTGETREASLFLATLAASNYTFAEATLDLTIFSWIQSHVHAFEFLGCVPEILAGAGRPDQDLLGEVAE
jgi:transposase